MLFFMTTSEAWIGQSELPERVLLDFGEVCHFNNFYKRLGFELLDFNTASVHSSAMRT